MKRFVIALLFAASFASPAFARVLDIQTFTTPKGITVWMVEDHSMPVIALSFAFRSGAASAPANKQGVSQLLSNTLDEGAGEIKSKEFQSALRDNAIDLSYGSSRDDFSGSMRTLTRHKDEAAKLLKLSVSAPRFDAEAVARMRNANLSRIRSSQGDAEWIGSRLLYDLIYKGHPYALNSGGTIASMQAMTGEDLRAEWKRLFETSRLVVGISGDLTKDDAAKMVDDIFGTVPVGKKLADLPRSEMPVAGEAVFYAKDMPQTILSMAWDGIGIHDPDYYAAVVMNYIYGGGGFSSRLMADVREKQGLTYGISSDMLDQDFADRFIVSASMQPQNVKATIDAVIAAGNAIKSADVTADELAAAQEYLVGSLPLAFSSSSRIAGALANLQLADRPATAFDDYRAKIEAVTPVDIKRAAARIFTKAPIVVMVGAAPTGVAYKEVKTLPNTEAPTP